MRFPTPDPGTGRVTAREAARLATTTDAVLLDVRELPEWRAGHAPEATHLPLSALAAGAALPAPAQARPLLVICRTGRRSQRAAEILTARGAHAVDVIGGMVDWAAAGLPVVDAHGGNGAVA
ncbi:rhodanese-like domain-containing protein [Streptomyces sp. NPDC006997]|uniref:rhodanese-like domain-containing protein n=1 Tax=Streptomyces sp. NPDC006997 TaxID=3155356 RepID=UPI0034050C10